MKNLFLIFQGNLYLELLNELQQISINQATKGYHNHKSILIQYETLIDDLLLEI
jgi:hypothetical protein